MTVDSRGKLLVTGGRGMLGNAVIAAAVAGGWQVISLQRHPSGMADGDSVIDALGSVTDRQAVSKAVAGCDGVIHLAARVGIEGRWSDFEKVNVTGTQIVVEQAQAAGAKSFVYVSSPSVAHIGEPLVSAGATPAEPNRVRGHYSRSKALAEQWVLGCTGIDTVAIRPHLVWGPGDEQLVGRIVSRARSGRLFLVDGGRALIDTTYVDNAADALVHSVSKAGDPRVRGKAFVVSNGEPRPVRNVVDGILAAAGVNVSPRSVAFRPAWIAGALGEWVGSVTKREPLVTRFLVEQLATAHWFEIRDTWDRLGWRPLIGLDEGMARLAHSFSRIHFPDSSACQIH
jgi:nucleoside-diphosphate-sugar epimerase